MEVPRHWRSQQQRYRLKGEVCPHCQAKVFPPRPVCPTCGHGLVQHPVLISMLLPVSAAVNSDR